MFNVGGMISDLGVVNGIRSVVDVERLVCVGDSAVEVVVFAGGLQETTTKHAKRSETQSILVI